MTKFSIVIPAYNEENRIGSTLKEYFDYFGDLKKSGKLDFEIIVVLNACKDNTLGVVEMFKCDELKILEFERGGKGFAIVEGFKDGLKGDSEYVGFVDADGATPASAFYDLVKSVEIEGVDGVIGDRWNEKSVINARQPFMRRFVSRGFNFIIRSLFILNHRDTQCGAKIFSRDLLEKIIPKLGSTEWTFDVDLLFYARREKARVLSVPTVWNDKEESKINLSKAPIRMFSSVVRLRLLHSPLSFVVRLYTKVPERFKFHHRL